MTDAELALLNEQAAQPSGVVPNIDSPLLKKLLEERTLLMRACEALMSGQTQWDTAYDLAAAARARAAR